MRGLVGLVFLLCTASAWAQDNGAVETLQSLNDEIGWNCTDLRAGGPSVASSATAILNATENVARNQPDLAPSELAGARAAFEANRGCFDMLLGQTGIAEDVRSRLRVALARIGQRWPQTRGGDAAATTVPPGPQTSTASSPRGEDDTVKHFFPWPPPPPSAFHVEDLSVVPGRKVLAVYDKVRQRLEAIGYRQYHFLAPGGFAIVADVENIDLSGKPTSNRWKKSVRRLTNFDLASIMRGILAGDLGRYRVMVIILTSDSSPFSNKTFSDRLLDDWKAAGRPLIQADLLNQEVGAAHHLFFLIYEFDSTKSGMDFVKASQISWQAHLEGAGLSAVELR